MNDRPVKKEDSERKDSDQNKSSNEEIFKNISLNYEWITIKRPSLIDWVYFVLILFVILNVHTKSFMITLNPLCLFIIISSNSNIPQIKMPTIA